MMEYWNIGMMLARAGYCTERKPQASEVVTKLRNVIQPHSGGYARGILLSPGLS